MDRALIVRQPHDKALETEQGHGRAVTCLARQVELSLIAVDLSAAQYRFLACLDEGTAEP